MGKKNNKYDIAIIGAGVTGAAIARCLSAYRLSVALLEKEADVSFGTSKANSGIIHGGFHNAGNYLKTRLEVQGNLMFDRLAHELDFSFSRCGILVVAFTAEEMKVLDYLYEQGLENGAVGIELCSREKVLSLEPKVNSDIVGGLHAPGGGIIEPYRFVYSLVESAEKNGVDLFTNFQVLSRKRENGFYVLEDEGVGSIASKYVINAAGLYADEVSRLFGAEEFKIRPRKGEYHILDRRTEACPRKVLFPAPGKVSKGMLVIPTVEGTVLIGPTAEPVRDKTDLGTSSENMDKIFNSARRMIDTISSRDVITSFAGIRPALESEDFLIKISGKTPNFIQVAGIQSPGLTAAPAIAEYVKGLLKKSGCVLVEKSEYEPFLDKVERIRDLNPHQADKRIKRNPAYGNIVCRCENVSEGEVVEAVRRGHTTLDGVKFFTRAGMGRCQGGFCTGRLMKIIKCETGIAMEDITKRGGSSKVAPYKIGELPIEKKG